MEDRQLGEGACSRCRLRMDDRDQHRGEAVSRLLEIERGILWNSQTAAQGHPPNLLGRNADSVGEGDQTSRKAC